MDSLWTAATHPPTGPPVFHSEPGRWKGRRRGLRKKLKEDSTYWPFA